MKYYHYKVSRDLNKCGLILKRTYVYLPEWLVFNWNEFKNYELYLKEDDDKLAKQIIKNFYEKKIAKLEARLAHYKKTISEMRVEEEAS